MCSQEMASATVQDNIMDLQHAHILLFSPDLSKKMLTFPAESATDHVKLKVSQTNFKALTVCHRSFTDLTRGHTLFSLASPSTANEFLIFYNSNMQMAPSVRNITLSYKNIDYAPNKWHSVCTTWDSSTGVVQLWIDGQPLTRKFCSKSPISGQPMIILGQEQDSYGGGFDIKQSFTGMMTDVHVWDYVLLPSEIQKYMRDQNYTQGNVVNWSALNHEISGNVLIEDKQTCHICQCN